jgi:hypothetical protein
MEFAKRSSAIHLLSAKFVQVGTSAPVEFTSARRGGAVRARVQCHVVISARRKLCGAVSETRRI